MCIAEHHQSLLPLNDLRYGHIFSTQAFTLRSDFYYCIILNNTTMYEKVVSPVFLTKETS